LETLGSDISQIDTIKKKLETLGSDISQIDTIKKKLETLGSDISQVDTIKKKLETLGSDISQIDTIKKKLETLGSDISQIDTIKKKLETLESNISQIDAIKKKLETFGSNVSQIDAMKKKLETLGSNVSQIDAMKKKLNILSSNVSQIDAMKKKLETLDSNVSQIDAMKEKLETLDSNVSQIDVMKKKLETLDSNVSQIDALNKKLETLGSDVSQIDIKVENLLLTCNKRYNDNYKRIVTNVQKIRGLVNTNESNDTNLETIIPMSIAHDSAIKAITKDVNNLMDTKVLVIEATNSHETAIKSLESTLKLELEELNSKMDSVEETVGRFSQGKTISGLLSVHDESIKKLQSLSNTFSINGFGEFVVSVNQTLFLSPGVFLPFNANLICIDVCTTAEPSRGPPGKVERDDNQRFNVLLFAESAFTFEKRTSEEYKHVDLNIAVPAKTKLLVSCNKKLKISSLILTFKYSIVY
jgi:prefoldin subunit 5